VEQTDMRYKINVTTNWTWLWHRLGSLVLFVCLTNCSSLTSSNAKPANLTNIYAKSVADMTLTVPVLDSQVVLRTSANFGGAVYSLVFRGKEHIDSRDHGRLLQSASSFEHYGECFNPTEGGAAFDPRSETSSQFKSGYVKKNQLWTASNMAFWLRPRQTYPKGCGLHKEITQAVNTEVISGHLLEKKITVGLADFPNVIEHKVTFHVPNNFSFGMFEVSTGYMPKEFSLALFFDPVKGQESDASHRTDAKNPKEGKPSLPVILATPDRNYAMGVYSKNKLVGYGRYSFPNVNKWNCGISENNLLPKAYQYTCLIILGTVDEVEKTMQRLAQP
jgi:hypothetical protein